MYEYLKIWLELKTDKRAVTMLEYGLIAAVIVVTIIGGYSLLANKLSTQFTSVGNHLNAP
jgi:pilus assembly protein Flp/PilA